MLTVGRMLGPNWLLRASLIRVLGGEMTGGELKGAETATLDAGWSAGVQLSRRWTVRGWPALYLGASVALAASRTTARYESKGPAHNLVAADVRFGGVAGWTFFATVTPYVAARLFGGPVSWKTTPGGAAQMGTDRYHVQLAGGLSANLPAGFYLSAEWAPLGELGLSSELGLRF